MFKKFFRNNFVQAVVFLTWLIAPVIIIFYAAQSLPSYLKFFVPFALSTISVYIGYIFFVRKFYGINPIEVSLSTFSKHFPIGIFCGFGTAILTFSLLIITNAVSIEGANEILLALSKIPEITFVALFEEVIFRAVILKILINIFNIRISIIISSLLFVLAHTPNEGFSILALCVTFIASASFGMAFLQSGNIWFPIGIHFAWNTFFEVFLALPVSGHQSSGFINVLRSGPDWLSGGSYGVEGSLITLLTWTITFLLLLRSFLKSRI